MQQLTALFCTSVGKIHNQASNNTQLWYGNSSYYGKATVTSRVQQKCEIAGNDQSTVGTFSTGDLL